MTFRMAMAHFPKFLGRVDGLLAAPYGYTVSLWTAGATASAHFGLPSTGETLLFAAGAVSAFLLLGYAGRRYIGREVPGRVPSVIVANGVALIAAILVGLICTLIPWPLVGFGVSGFSVTLTYGLSLAAFLTFTPEVLHRFESRARAPSINRSPVWLFDLDNTLYPADAGLMDTLSARISQFIEQRLNLPHPVAEALRNTYYKRYGSSVCGILRHCQVDVDEFLAFTHDLPIEHYLTPAPHLETMLASLPGHKYIFTNAPAAYARRVLRALGIEHHFEEIFDIQFAEFEAKPAPAAYEKVLAALGHPAGVCWFVEDSVQNLIPAKAFGCRTIWLTQQTGPRPVYVDYIIHELDELLELIPQAGQVY